MKVMFRWDIPHFRDILSQLNKSHVSHYEKKKFTKAFGLPVVKIDIWEAFGLHVVKIDI